MERWIGSFRRQILDRTLIWNQRHLLAAPRREQRRYLGVEVLAKSNRGGSNETEPEEVNIPMAITA